MNITEKVLKEKTCDEIITCDRLLKQINLGKINTSQFELYRQDICLKKPEECYLN